MRRNHEHSTNYTFQIHSNLFDNLFIAFSILQNCVVKSKTYSPLLRRSLKTIPPNAPFAPLPSSLIFQPSFKLTELSAFSKSTAKKLQTKSWKQSQIIKFFWSWSKIYIMANKVDDAKINAWVLGCINVFIQLYSWIVYCIDCISPNGWIVFLSVGGLVSLGSCVSWCVVSSAEWMMGPATAEHHH